MTQLPLVSIITPSYNQVHSIERTILSVCQQDYPHIEHWIIDGGSTDGTLEILRQYEGRVFWISERDKGQADALNKGFRRAKGEILGWLNSDDYYEPGAIRTAVEFFLAHPDVEMVYGDCYYVYEREGQRRVELFRSRPFDLELLIDDGCFIAQPAAFFRKSALEVGLLDTRLNYVMDYDLWIRIGKCKKVEYLPVVLANFTFSEHSKSGATPHRFWPETRRVSRRHGGRFFSEMYVRHWRERLQGKRRFLYRPARFAYHIARRVVAFYHLLGAKT